MFRPFFSRRRAPLIEAIHRAMVVIEFDPQGNILTANQNFLKTVYGLEELEGRHHRIFCGSMADSAEHRHFWERLNASGFMSWQFRRFDKTGRMLWLEATYTPIFDDDGQLYKVIKFASDITGTIDNLQQLSCHASTSMHTCRESVEKSVGMAGNAGKAIVRISACTNDMVAAVRNMASTADLKNRPADISLKA